MKKTVICFLLLLKMISSHAQPGTDTTISLYFQRDLYAVTDEHKVLLNAVLQGNRFKVKSIEGFADTTAGANYNMGLSKRRTEAVYDYLLGRNWVDTTVKQLYFGEQYLGNTYPFNERKVEIGLARINADSSAIPGSLVLVTRYELSNIYFRPDQAVIEPFSIDAINDIAAVLKKFQGCKFEITGHVNYNLPEAGKRDAKTLAYIQRLSEDRARAVFDILVDKGIPPGDMKYKGMGNSQMIYKNPVNEEEKRKNMRVEISVYCSKNQ